MTTTRAGRAIGRDLQIPAEEIEDFTRKHWGLPPDFVYEHGDPRIPAKWLPEMGKIQEIAVQVVDDAGRRIGDLHIDFPDDDRCILAYDRRTHRLYLGYPDDLHAKIARRLWRPGQPTYGLAHYADAMRAFPGGRVGRHSAPGRAAYPKVQVQGLGPVEHVIYWTHKRGHGPSRYKHELGENTKIRPDLCVSEDGSLWFAGGNYTVEKHGIID
jgi:hypothetical protein